MYISDPDTMTCLMWSLLYLSFFGASLIVCTQISAIKSRYDTAVTPCNISFISTKKITFFVIGAHECLRNETLIYIKYQNLLSFTSLTKIIFVADQISHVFNHQFEVLKICLQQFGSVPYELLQCSICSVKCKRLIFLPKILCMTKSETLSLQFAGSILSGLQDKTFPRLQQKKLQCIYVVTGILNKDCSLTAKEEKLKNPRKSDMFDCVYAEFISRNIVSYSSMKISTKATSVLLAECIRKLSELQQTLAHEPEDIKQCDHNKNVYFYEAIFSDQNLDVFRNINNKSVSVFFYIRFSHREDNLNYSWLQFLAEDGTFETEWQRKTVKTENRKNKYKRIMFVQRNLRPRRLISKHNLISKLLSKIQVQQGSKIYLADELQVPVMNSSSEHSDTNVKSWIQSHAGMNEKLMSSKLHREFNYQHLNDELNFYYSSEAYILLVTSKIHTLLTTLKLYQPEIWNCIHEEMGFSGRFSNQTVLNSVIIKNARVCSKKQTYRKEKHDIISLNNHRSAQSILQIANKNTITSKLFGTFLRFIHRSRLFFTRNYINGSRYTVSDSQNSVTRVLRTNFQSGRDIIYISVKESDISNFITGKNFIWENFKLYSKFHHNFFDPSKLRPATTNGLLSFSQDSQTFQDIKMKANIRHKREIKSAGTKDTVSINVAVILPMTQDRLFCKERVSAAIQIALEKVNQPSYDHFNPSYFVSSTLQCKISLSTSLFLCSATPSHEPIHRMEANKIHVRLAVLLAQT